MQVPKWNPEATSPKSVLTAGAVGCTAVSGFVKTNKIVCTFTEDINTAKTIDKLTITGEFDSTTTSIVFRVSNFRNPPSLTSYSGISITTSTSTTTQQIDQATSVTFPVTTVATLDSSRVTVTLGNTKINTQTTYTFNIRVSLPLPTGSSIQLTFPSTATPATTGLVVTGNTNLNSDITESYATGTRVLTLTNLVPSGSYVDEGFYIDFTVNLVTNPSNTKASDSFSYASFDASSKGIEAFTSGVTVTATAGSITGASVVPTVTTIRTTTSYTFKFQTENEVPVGAILYIEFPSIIVATDRTNTNCLSSGVNIDSTNAVCTVTSNKYLTITTGFGSTATAAGTEISFAVSDITNYYTTETSATFVVQTQTSSSYIIDMYQLGALTVSATVGTISGLTITPSSYETGVQTTYQFRFTISEAILINSYIQITFPADVTIPDTSYSAGTCQTVIGLSGGITCSFSTTQIVKLSNGFTTGDFLSGTLLFTIEGIQNPRSVQPTSTFSAIIDDSSGNGQYAITSGLTLTMTTPVDFLSISLASGSPNNGAITNYTFSITLSNKLVVGDYVRITFPAEISLSTSTPTCNGSTNLASSLTCTLSSSVLDVAIATSSGATELAANTLIVFVIQGVQNPSTLSESSSFQVETLTSDKQYRINLRTTGLTVTNSERGSISSTTAIPESTALNTSTTYTFSFTPTNTIPQNAFIQIGLPESVTVPTGTTSLTCTAASVIESTLVCAYESANKMITITNGFLTATSYAVSQVSIKVAGLINPETAQTIGSFTIETKSQEGISIDYVGSGVTYVLACNSPCLTCSGSLSTCTSCDASSGSPYLYSNTCASSCPSGYYQGSDKICRA